MIRADVITWVKNEFLPLTLATDDTVIGQQFDNAVRYFNTNSGFKITEMVNVDSGATSYRVQLPVYFKGVTKVYPATQTEWIYRNHPLWTLLGIQIIDNLTPDLIMMGEAFKGYRMYIGTDFTWSFQKSDDPAVGPSLYLRNIPDGSTRMAVVGTKRLLTTDNIKQEHILNFILYYTKALVKMIEGNTLRKSALINANNDGQALFDEGKTEMKELQESLAKGGRWTAFSSRF